MLGIQPKSDPNQFFCSHAFLFFTMLFVTCVAGVDRGRGRGNLGAREPHTLSLAPKFPLPPSPSPFNAGHAGYALCRGSIFSYVKESCWYPAKEHGRRK